LFTATVLAPATERARLFFLESALEPGDQSATKQLVAESVDMRACLEALRPHWRAAPDECASNELSLYRRSGVGIGCMGYGNGITSQPNPSGMRGGIDKVRVEWCG
jgi:hypothetical protein